MHKHRSIKNKRLKLTSRDINILLFLWQWKVVSTSGLAVKFFPGSKNHAAYVRLNALENNKYIKQAFVDWSCKFAWKLTKKGYTTIKGYLPEQTDKSRGYGGEFLHHDFLVSAFHIGNWIKGKPVNTGLVSEQQLRRQTPGTLPSWVPKVDLHNTDGYWYIKNRMKDTVIALEVELTKKSPEKYKTWRTFYSTSTTIDHCVWVVRSRSIANYFLELMNSDSDTPEDMHQFLLAKDVNNYNWGAEIILGSKSGTIFSDFINDFTLNKPLKKTDNDQGKKLVESGIS